MGLRDVGFLTPSSTALPCNSPPDELAETEDRAGDNFDVDLELGNFASLEPKDFVGALLVGNLGTSFDEVGEDFAGAIWEEEVCTLDCGDVLGAALAPDVDGDRGGFLFDEGDIFGEEPTDDDGDDLVEDPLDDD